MDTHQIIGATVGLVGLFAIIVIQSLALRRKEQHLDQAHDTLTEVSALFLNELSLNVRLESHHEEHIDQRAKDIERITKADLKWARATAAAMEHGIDLDDMLNDYELKLANLPEPSEDIDLDPAVIGEQLAAELNEEIAAEQRAAAAEYMAERERRADVAEAVSKDIFAIADAVNENMD